MKSDSSYNRSTLFFLSASIFLALTLFATISIKSMLSDCSFFRSDTCDAELADKKTLLADIKKTEKEIEDLQNKISEIECEDESIYENIAEPEKEEIEPAIDAPLWNEGNLNALEGCWDLAWDYSMTLSSTGQKVKVLSWGMCFENSSELGRQTVEFDNGTVCQDKPIKAEFNKTGSSVKLLLSDTRNVQCTNNTYIVERRALCVLSEDAMYADCKTIHIDDLGRWPPYPANINVKLVRRK
ncbi:MAG: hypothetical protein K0U57_07715 [Alphaproteobacteria bacterium]|nr:hypothetical protein [Alphaproteobacteria bacterium]